MTCEGAVCIQGRRRPITCPASPDRGSTDEHAQTEPPADDKAARGDTLYALCNPRRMIVVRDPAELTRRRLSAYDELKNRLMKVKERHRAASDADEIIVAAESRVLYDKIVHIMDVAREAEFPEISIAKLRG